MNGSMTSALTTLHLSVNNHPGVLSHVCGLFAGRAYNLEGVMSREIASGFAIDITSAVTRYGDISLMRLSHSSAG